MQAAAQTLSVELQSVAIRSPSQIASAFEAVLMGSPDALIGSDDNLLVRERTQVLKLAAETGLIAMWSYRSFVEAGGLMCYGVNVSAFQRRAAYYVDRILKGAKPADLPVEQPREFEFVINLKTAQALGLTIPQHVLLQATEVIQ